MAVWDKIMYDRPAYRSPEHFLDYDPSYQAQCAIQEHIMRYAGIIPDTA